MPLDEASLRAAVAARAPPPRSRRSPSACSSRSCTPSTSGGSARRSGRRCRACAVSLSSELLPEFREYERCSTTVANAYLAPALSAYLERDRAAAARDAVVRRGRRRRRCRGRAPAACVLSGPAAGVVGAAFVAGASGRDVLTFDMGGTSTDVAARARRRGAGDGRVGRRRASRSASRWWTCTRSAPAAARSPGSTRAVRCGSDRARPARGPGPACYGRGGEQPTVTDANLVLGYLGGRRRARRRGAARPGRAERALARSGLQTPLDGVDGWRRRSSVVERGDGAGAAGRQRRARDRPARAGARRLRRRRAAARLLARRGARHRARARPARLRAC